jgi:hypothetical protein
MFLKANLILCGLLVSSVTANEYQEWLQSQQSSYNSYKKSIDEEFADMLKKDWEAFQQMYNPSPFTKPKPKEIPKAKVIKPPVKELKASPKVVIKNELAQPKIIKPTITIKPKKILPSVTVEYFGNSFEINYDKKLQVNISSVSQQSIIKFWESVAEVKSKNIIDQIKQVKKDLKLNDWGVYQLVYKFASQINSNQNSITLVTWYLMTKLGYDTKVAYNSNTIYLLAQTSHKLYQVAFFELDSKRYYVLSPNGRMPKVGKVFTYNGNYPKAKNSVSMAITDEILLNNQQIEKTLEFVYEHKKYKVNSKFSQNLVDFYATFPQSDYLIYYNDTDSSLLNASVVTQLAAIIENKSELEAVNILLRFVQTSFAYKTDDDQFKHEKVMFPQETLHHPYSDCEDRSIMFTYLVKKLLHLDVVGVKYSDHMAAAVAFSSNISGDGFIYKGKRYIVTDPTYINANSGMTMPQYKGKQFEVIGS